MVVYFYWSVGFQHVLLDNISFSYCVAIAKINFPVVCWRVGILLLILTEQQIDVFNLSLTVEVNVAIHSVFLLALAPGKAQNFYVLLSLELKMFVLFNYEHFHSSFALDFWTLQFDPN